MALLPKKTYSRCNNDLSVLNDRDRENVDPFDELLSSPLKQEVHFQPLSFWGKKDLESKKNFRSVKCGLYETSDSDEFNSPRLRKRKPKSKYSVQKARSLQPKSSNHMLNSRGNNNYSTSYSPIKRIRFHKPIKQIENKSLIPTEEFGKFKGWPLGNILGSNQNAEEKLNSLCKNSDDFNFNAERDFTKTNYSYNFNENFQKTLKSCISGKKVKKNSSKVYFEKKITNLNNLKFKIYEDTYTPEKQSESTADETALYTYKESLTNNILNFNESTEKALTPVYKHRNSFQFITTKRHFNYPKCIDTPIKNASPFSDSIRSQKINTSSGQFLNALEITFSPTLKKCEDNAKTEDYLKDIDNETLVHNDEDSPNKFIDNNKSLDDIICIKNSATLINEESKTLLEHQSENISDDFDLKCLTSAELEDLIQELLEEQSANLKDGVTFESSSTSDDTFCEHNDEDTVVKIASGSEKDLLITVLDEEKDTFLTDFQNVTTKRKNVLNTRYGKNITLDNSERINESNSFETERENTETKFEIDYTAELSQTMDRMSLDWNRSNFCPSPVFESTRVFEVGSTNGKAPQRKPNQSEGVLDKTGCDQSYILKPGKKWLRSLSILKQIQTGSIPNYAENRFESTRITGRKFGSFVQEMLEMQNDKSGFFTSLMDISLSNIAFTPSEVKNSSTDSSVASKVYPDCKSLSENTSEFNVTDNDSFFSKSVSGKTFLEKSLLGHTVKVIQPEEKPNAFRSALGLDINHSVSQDSVQEGSLLSARDFILIQCGQEDVLPFEDHFNESTLKNSKKIGEGVYGEVFMCSDSVIKIIPIEGKEKVNGEPQKTFEEIISEVVIALKLSDLRKGEKHRTDGFSELKRCWCVKGKYPKYLLQLWDEYDKLGGGSENDSPVMFKEDQLYIILELANGGKDLESFCFSSSVQSLSVFIQAAFSLAAAEKAFEFEHRDLHWGNVLISETKEKFKIVVLDGIEYKIPTKGVKVCIIDFTLSRINHEGCCIFNDLSVDPGLFVSEGDYQFEIYRMMLQEVKNDWSLFRPKTNLFWLHYTLDKMIKMVRYKNKKAKVHAKCLKDLKILELEVLMHEDSMSFVLSDSFNDIVNKL